MHALQVTGLTGAPRSVDETTLATFGGDLDGTLLRPDQEGYAESTAIWNGMITKRPALVVRAGSTRDAVRTVDFVRDHGLELSIRGGGHNIAGLALTDGGIMLDLSGLRTVEVDVAAHRARVGPGCTLGDVDRATQEHGLATTLGFVSATGVAGLTLGGGFGYLTRRFGWTVDELEEVEIVIADGSTLRASRSENADLFWALRGGGGNFGVVTEFTFRLHEVGPLVTAGLIAWPADRAGEVLETYRRVTESAPRELTLAVLRRNAPPAPWLPEAAHGTPIVAIVACHSGNPEQAQADLAPVKAVGRPLADLIQVKDYVAQQSMLDATQPKGMHFYWKSEYVPRLSDELLAAYHRQFVDLAAPANQIVLFHLAGAVNEHPEDDGDEDQDHEVRKHAPHVCLHLTHDEGDEKGHEEDRRNGEDDGHGDRIGDLPPGELRHFGRRRRPGRDSDEEEACGELRVLLHRGDEPDEGKGEEGNSDEVREEREAEQPPVLHRCHEVAEAHEEPGEEHAREDEDVNGNGAEVVEECGHKSSSSIVLVARDPF
jgi:FAD/FMN-containing dehydrogenase